MTARRFPAPCTVEEYRGISYIVRDAKNFAVAYVYFEAQPGRRAAANFMTKDEGEKGRRTTPLRLEGGRTIEPSPTMSSVCRRETWQTWTKATTIIDCEVGDCLSLA